MSLPVSFKRAVFTEAGGRLSIEETPLQRPSKNEVLVKVEACGVCHSDTAVQHNFFGGGLYVTAISSLLPERARSAGVVC